jgi:hypothetical protein
MIPGALHLAGSVARTIWLIEACKTADEVFAVVTGLLTGAQTTRGAFAHCHVPTDQVAPVRKVRSRVLSSPVDPSSYL